MFAVGLISIFHCVVTRTVNVEFAKLESLVKTLIIKRRSRILASRTTNQIAVKIRRRFRLNAGMGVIKVQTGLNFVYFEAFFCGFQGRVSAVWYIFRVFWSFMGLLFFGGFFGVFGGGFHNQLFQKPCFSWHLRAFIKL